MREVFRCIVVKIWVAFPTENVNFRVHDKTLLRKAIDLCSEFWRECCEASHSPECEKLVYKKMLDRLEKM